MGRKCKLSKRRKYSNRPPRADRPESTTLVLSVDEEVETEEEDNIPMLPPVVTDNTGGRKKKEIKQDTKVSFLEDRNWEHQQNKRSAVAFVFLNLLYSPPKKEWKGAGGLIRIACQMLQLDFNSNCKLVEHVFVAFDKTNSFSDVRCPRSLNK